LDDGVVKKARFPKDVKESPDIVIDFSEDPRIDEAGVAPIEMEKLSPEKLARMKLEKELLHDERNRTPTTPEEIERNNRLFQQIEAQLAEYSKGILEFKNFELPIDEIQNEAIEVEEESEENAIVVDGKVLYDGDDSINDEDRRLGKSMWEAQDDFHRALNVGDLRSYEARAYSERKGRELSPNNA